jgi:hypothetical protein
MVVSWTITGPSLRLLVNGIAGERERLEEDEPGLESVPAGEVFLEDDVLICSR